MNKVSVTPDIIRKASRFALTGLLVTLVHVCVAFVFIEFILPNPSLANGVAFAIATLASYLINTLWSFSCTLHRKGLIRFGMVSFTGLFLSMAISGVAQYSGLHYWYGIVFVICIVPPYTFVLHNFWTYK